MGMVAEPIAPTLEVDDDELAPEPIAPLLFLDEALIAVAGTFGLTPKLCISSFSSSPEISLTLISLLSTGADLAARLSTVGIFGSVGWIIGGVGLTSGLLSVVATWLASVVLASVTAGWTDDVAVGLLGTVGAATIGVADTGFDRTGVGIAIVFFVATVGGNDPRAGVETTGSGTLMVGFNPVPIVVSNFVLVMLEPNGAVMIGTLGIVKGDFEAFTIGTERPPSIGATNGPVDAFATALTIGAGSGMAVVFVRAGSSGAAAFGRGTNGEDPVVESSWLR